MIQPLSADPTLDEIRDALIADVAANAAFDGWTEQAVVSAAGAHQLDPDIAQTGVCRRRDRDDRPMVRAYRPGDCREAAARNAGRDEDP